MRGEPAAALIALACAFVVACDGAPCARHSDCDPGLVCSPSGACLVPIDGDAGADAAPDAAVDAGLDAAVDAAVDAGVDAAPDAALDAGPPIDAAIDAVPATLESPYAGPAIPEVALPHALTP